MVLSTSHIRAAANKVTGAALPADLVDWLTKLKLLYGIPFNYLVPDEQFLPMETLRFFQVDDNWISSLTDGALSIGRHYNGTDNPPPTAYIEQHHKMMLHLQPNNRLHAVRQLQLSMEVKATLTAKAPVNNNLTGFLLRSSVVSGWKNMDVMGYQKGSSPFDYEQGIITDPSQVVSLDIMRLERLSENVLLGIFKGPLYELVFHEPPEAIHFGFDQVSPNLTKTLRVPTVNWDDPGTQYNTDTYQDQPVNNPYADESARVLNMMQLSKQLGSMLAACTGFPAPAPGYYQASPINDNYKNHLVSSDFALEMVKGSGLVSFINQTPPTT